MTEIRHHTLTELMARLPEIQSLPPGDGVLVQIVARPDKDLRELRTVSEVTPEAGMPGDRWARYCTKRLPDGRLNPSAQLTLMNTRCLALLTDDQSRWPLAGDNLLVDFNLSETNAPVGQRLRIGSAILEITEEPHTGCSKFSKRYGPDAVKFVNSPEGKRLRLRGVNAQVVQAGKVRVGDVVERL